MDAIEERGEIVSPSALAREMSPAKPPDVLGGRNAEDFKAATEALGVLRETCSFITNADVGAILVEEVGA